jgi:hypothetical protein
MAVVLGSTPWPPSDIQAGVPLDNDRPGDSALQRAANASNRAWLDVRNYLWAFPRALNGAGTTQMRLPSGTAATVFVRLRAHVPEGASTFSLTVRGSVSTGTASVRLLEDGVAIATVTLTTTVATTTAFGVVTTGDRVFTVDGATAGGQTMTVLQAWLSWADFT